VTNTVKTFTDVDECVNFMGYVEDERTFIISSRGLG
jgi:hypothetical protein